MQGLGQGLRISVVCVWGEGLGGGEFGGGGCQAAMCAKDGITYTLSFVNSLTLSTFLPPVLLMLAVDRLPPLSCGILFDLVTLWPTTASVFIFVRRTAVDRLTATAGVVCAYLCCHCPAAAATATAAAATAR